MEIKNITAAAAELETGEIRIAEAIDLLRLIMDDMDSMDDMDETDTHTEHAEVAALLLAARYPKHISSLDILRQFLETVKNNLHDASAACYAAGKRDRETVERVKREAARYEIAELASGKDGVDICEIIRGMGYSRLSDVAPEELDKVLDRVRQEVRKAQDA